MPGVVGIKIDIETNVVEIEHSEGITTEQITAKLHKMGYPLPGSVNGFEALKTSAKSYVSCAIGRTAKQE